MLFAADHIEFRRGMALVIGAFGGGVTFALFGHHMDQDRPRRPRLDRAQNRQQLVHVVTVQRSDIGKAQLFEQGAANGHAFQHFLGPFGALLERRGQQADRAFGGGFEFLKRVPGIKPRQIRRQRPNRRRNRHIIVVQHNDQPLAQMARVVHRLKRHARAHRPVANHCDGIADPGLRRAAQIPRNGKAKSGRDRGRTMRRPKGVIGAFGSFGKPRQTALLAQGPNTVAPPSQNLVRIALMRHVPDDFVARRVKHRMQRHGQFNHTQPGPKMTAGFRHGGNRFRPQFARDLTQIIVTKLL